MFRMSLFGKLVDMFDLRSCRMWKIRAGSCSKVSDYSANRNENSKFSVPGAGRSSFLRENWVALSLRALYSLVVSLKHFERKLCSASETCSLFFGSQFGAFSKKAALHSQYMLFILRELIGAIFISSLLNIATTVFSLNLKQSSRVACLCTRV